jgi:ribosomal protein S12 methylthiotransferase accessory factor
MYGEEILGNATSSVSGKIRFFGLTPTNMKLDGIDKHLRLIESYEKLQVARHRHHVSSSAT